MHRLFFILGPLSPMMLMISKILDVAGVGWTWATQDGRRVDHSDAWQADGTEAPIPPDHILVAVDCRLDEASMVIRTRITEAKCPQGYWEASAIGQVWRMLCEDDPRLTVRLQRHVIEARLAAAHQTCPEHAALGQCQGIDPALYGDWLRRIHRAEETRAARRMIRDSIVSHRDAQLGGAG